MTDNELAILKTIPEEEIGRRTWNLFLLLHSQPTINHSSIPQKWSSCKRLACQEAVREKIFAMQEEARRANGL